MIKFLLLLILPFALHASKILSYNIYERTDRVDVMITFDTPYDGVIKQNIGDSTITIKLLDASIESEKLKQLTSKYIKSINITPMTDYTQVVAVVPPSVSLKASKTSDGYGLRLRFATEPVLATNTEPAKEEINSQLSSLPTKKGDDISTSYYIVIAILIIGITLLFLIKKRVMQTETKHKPSSWLFKNNQEATKEVNMSADNNVSIRFQKAINSENSVVMLDFAEQSYLVLMGKSNILLDKFTDNKPTTKDDFETILQSRHKELNDFLHGDSESKEPLQAYKERAASIRYEV